MAIHEVEEFVAKEQAIDFGEDEALFKIWLIPSKDSKSFYIVAKHLHCAFDGLNFIQILALMQDG